MEHGGGRTNTLLRMIIPTIFMTIFRTRIMNIHDGYLMTTILPHIRNMFVIVILKTYTQPSSFTTSIAILVMTEIRLVTVILPLTNSSMGAWW